MAKLHSMLGTRELLNEWYVEYVQIPGSALSFDTWYMVKGRERLLAFLMTEHDDMVEDFTKEAAKILEYKKLITGR